MLVRTIIRHQSSDGAEHAEQDRYELEGLELELRLKDQIVAPADAPVRGETSVADAIAHARESVASSRREE